MKFIQVRVVPQTISFNNPEPSYLEMLRRGCTAALQRCQVCTAACCNTTWNQGQGISILVMAWIWQHKARTSSAAMSLRCSNAAIWTWQHCNNLWWMKLCVYGVFDTNAIQAICAKSITCINYNMNFIYFLNEANHRVKWTHYN